jgi:hypothetical protein
MKVVIQNGAYHGLARREAEAVIRQLPLAWSKDVHQVLLVRGDSLRTSFYPKQNTVCLHSPRGPLSPEDKCIAVSLLLDALAKASGHEPPDDLEQRCHSAISPPF